MGETFLLLYLREIGLIARSFLIDMKYYDVRSRIQATHQPIISMVSLFLTSVYRSLSLSFCLRSVSKAGTLEPPRSTEVFDLEAETGQTHRCLHQETILAWKGEKKLRLTVMAPRRTIPSIFRVTSHWSDVIQQKNTPNIYIWRSKVFCEIVW